MEYFPFLVILIIGVCIFLYRKNQTELLRKYGIRTKGIIIFNEEDNESSFFKLGGNFNKPTIQFFTKEGKEIIGTPLIGFTSQKEIVTQTEVLIIYDQENPEKFCIDLGLLQYWLCSH